MLTRPSLLFLDEPTMGLDPEAEEILVELVEKMANDGRHTVVMVTHAAAVALPQERFRRHQPAHPQPPSPAPADGSTPKASLLLSVVFWVFRRLCSPAVPTPR